MQGTRLSLRAFARQLGIEPSYLSKIEREEFPPPSEELIVKIAKGLGEDPDLLLALAGKIASDVKEAIIASEGGLAKVIRNLVRSAGPQGSETQMVTAPGTDTQKGIGE